MPLVLTFGQYFIPIKLTPATKEKEGIKHALYVCEKCKSDELTKFCHKCNSETTTIKFYPDGEKEEVGSRDLWDIMRVPISEVRLHEIEAFKWVEQVNFSKKPKASEIAKFREQKEKIGKSPQLTDLLMDLSHTKQALKGKIVLHSKINEVYFMPYKYNQNATLIAGLTDGNNKETEPKVLLKLEKPMEN